MKTICMKPFLSIRNFVCDLFEYFGIFWKFLIWKFWIIKPEKSTFAASPNWSFKSSRYCWKFWTRYIRKVTVLIQSFFGRVNSVKNFRKKFWDQSRLDFSTKPTSRWVFLSDKSFRIDFQVSSVVVFRIWSNKW